MSNHTTHISAQNKSLAQIESDIQQALTQFDAVRIAWKEITDAMAYKPYGEQSALRAWADPLYPKRWAMNGDDILIVR